jgi:cell division protein FtsA
MSDSQIITALDLGSSSIKVLIAKVTEDYHLEILGKSEVVTPKNSFTRGKIQDISKTAEEIKNAISKAESDAKNNAKNIYLSISGEYLHSENTSKKITLSDTGKIITAEDVESLRKSTISYLIRQKGHDNENVIHDIPQSYNVDEQEGIKNPVDMSGYTLENHLHVIMAAENPYQNIIRTIEKAGYEIKQPVASQLASSISVLEDQEKDLGVIILDIGAGTTDIAVYMKGNMKFSKVIPLGGSDVTNDLTIGLRTTSDFSEKIKIQNGSLKPSLKNKEEEISIKGIAGRHEVKKKLSFIYQIIYYRSEEILEKAYKIVMENTNANLINAGLVITGGTSLMSNIGNFAEEKFNLPTRIGYPKTDKIINDIKELQNPKYATAIGLLYFGLDSFKRKELKLSKAKSENSINFKSFFDKIKNLIKELS